MNFDILIKWNIEQDRGNKMKKYTIFGKNVDNLILLVDINSRQYE